MDLAEKKELAYNYYQENLDVDISLLRAGVTSEERDLILDDEDFRYRLLLVDAQVQEQIIVNLRELSQSSQDSVRLSATRDLGKLFYKKRFTTDLFEEDENSRPTSIVLAGKKMKVKVS